MTPDQKRLVQATWAQVAPMADATTELFYRRLIAIDPAIHKLFRGTDMAEQRRKLQQMMAVIVGGLDNVGALVSTVEDLGRRHIGYGVTDADYDSVGAALLWALEQALGRAWTPVVASAWTEVYGLLSGIMRRVAASSSVAGRSPAPWSNSRSTASRNSGACDNR
jgi:hemoglobin-like flavoprotein